MADQLMSLDKLAEASTGNVTTSLYTTDERTRLTELVNMDVDMETAASLYFDIAEVMTWPMEMGPTDEAGVAEPHIPNFEGDTYEYLEKMGIAASETRSLLPEEKQKEWDDAHREITTENYDETKKIQDTANRRRQDPEVQRFEKFLANGLNYMFKYWEENQTKPLASTGPKSPLVLTVSTIVSGTIEDGARNTKFQTVVASRKKNIFSAR